MVRTTDEEGWSRLENGDLLKAAEAEKFDVLLTADQNLTYQQNLAGRDIAIVVLGTNKRWLLEHNPHKLVGAIENVKPGGYQFVKYDLPRRPNRRPPS